MKYMLIALTGALVLWAGCNGSQDRLVPMTESSTARLGKIAADEPVVVSLAEKSLPATAGRSLGKFGDLQLLEISHADLPELSSAGQATVWGASRNVNKLDPRLRNKLLQMLAMDTWEGKTVDAIATFTTPTTNLPDELDRRGFRVGSLQDGIATLSGSPDALLDLLAYEPLRSLKLPNLLQPASGH